MQGALKEKQRRRPSNHLHKVRARAFRIHTTHLHRFGEGGEPRHPRSPCKARFRALTHAARRALRGLENTTPSLFSPSKLKVRTYGEVCSTVGAYARERETYARRESSEVSTHLLSLNRHPPDVLPSPTQYSHHPPDPDSPGTGKAGSGARSKEHPVGPGGL